MILRITAALLFALYSMTLAVSQPGLRFCACLETVFVGDCICSSEPSGNSESDIPGEQPLAQDADHCNEGCDTNLLYEHDAHVAATPAEFRADYFESGGDACVSTLSTDFSPLCAPASVGAPLTAGEFRPPPIPLYLVHSAVLI